MKVDTYVGQAAIEYAKAHNLTLSRYRDKTGPAKDGLTIEQAQEIAEHDSSLIYLTVVEGREE
jgi:hypothetical protein